MHAITLLFHDVVTNGQWDSSGIVSAGSDRFKLDVSEFCRHLQAIAERLPGPPLTTNALSSGSRVICPVLLTFDDGGVSGINPVAELLDELNWKAHFLITADWIGTPGFLNRSEIRELRQRGHVIGSHSFSHPARMSFCKSEELDKEWERSIGILTEIIGEPVCVASVPGGYYSDRVASSAAKYGIQVLFNSEPVARFHRVNGCLVLGRFTVKNGYPSKKSGAIAGGARIPRLQQYLLWNCKNVVKSLGGEAWLRARKIVFSRSVKISSGPGSNTMS